MKEKIIALIFGLLALGVVLGISVKHPSVESITASVFTLAIVVVAMVREIRYRLGLWKEHINYPQKWYEKLIYTILGL